MFRKMGVLSLCVGLAGLLWLLGPGWRVWAYPQAELDVVINEIAWMGATASANAEWLELYNPTASPIPLTGWTLRAADGTPAITLTGAIPAHGYYLLERASDATVPAVLADQVYSGGLSDAGEYLELRDAAHVMVDAVDCSGGWFAGHSVARVPMVRVIPTVTGSLAANWTYSPRCGSPTNAAGVSYTCALTTTVTGAALDYAVYFNERATTAADITLEPTTVETALLQVINQTTATLDVALYGLDRQSVVDALIAAHNRGVAVRVVGDNEASQAAGYSAAYQALQTAGIPLLTDAAPAIQHNKFVVGDGRVLWTGSTNLTDNCLTLNANNSIVITSTALAAAYTTEFAEMWGSAFHTAKTDNTPHVFDYQGTRVASYFSPTDLPAFAVWDELGRATDSVHFAMFFWTDPVLTQRVLARLADGVPVYGILDQLGAANAASADEQLCAGGATLGIENLPGLLHHKFTVLDVAGADPRVILGSYNWTDSGAYDNDENTLIIHDRALAEAYYAEWLRLWGTLAPGQICQPTALTQVQLTGPVTGQPLTAYDFLAATNPTLDVPITYTWQATGQPLVVHPDRGVTDTVQFTWATTGTQVITVTATNAFTTVVDSHILTLTAPAVLDHAVYLPLVAGNFSTAPPPTPDVRITTIAYDPPGDPVQDEYVRLQNFGSAAQALTGWTLQDASARTFTFPAFVLPAGGSVQVWTGSGTNTVTDLYWGGGTAIWNNTGDTAYLRDADGELVFTYSY